MFRLALLLVLTLLVGCQERPRAPDLRDDEVFDDSRHGLRFQTPPGWRQVARSDSPGNIADKELLLVRFQNALTGKPAVFEVTFIDTPESTDVVALLSAPSHSLRAWTPLGSPEPQSINGEPATRYALSQPGTNKDAYVFRRGKRLYTFSIAYAPADAKAVDQFRDAVKSVAWSK